MNIKTKGLLLCLAIGQLSSLCLAKHIRPKIEPVEINGIRFIAPNNQGFRGYVQAQDAETGTNLWERTIYRVIWRLPLPELDYYFCVIKEMKSKDGKLLIKNDRGKWYSLDPKTRKVRRIANEATRTNKDQGGQQPAPDYRRQSAAQPEP